MSFYTTKAFMLRENNGELGVELPSDIKELLKQRGLTVVFVSGDVECDGEFVRVINDKLTQDEITKEALQLLNKETSHMAGALGLPKPEKIKLPVVNIVPKIDSRNDLSILIKIAKKKLKKLQKRQRKQDKQGVSNTAYQWPSDTLDKFLAGKNEPYVINMIKHANITDEIMSVISERYGITKDNKGDEFIKPL